MTRLVKLRDVGVTVSSFEYRPNYEIRQKSTRGTFYEKILMFGPHFDRFYDFLCFYYYDVIESRCDVTPITFRLDDLQNLKALTQGVKKSMGL